MASFLTIPTLRPLNLGLKPDWLVSIDKVHFLKLLLFIMRGRIVRKRCVSRKRRSTTKGRRVRVIRGKGDYKTFFRKLGSGLKTFGKGVLKGVGGVEGFLTSGGKPQGFINGYKAGGTFKGALASARAGAKLLGVGSLLFKLVLK
jgi:hypothetical protein